MPLNLLKSSRGDKDRKNMRGLPLASPLQGPTLTPSRSNPLVPMVSSSLTPVSSRTGSAPTLSPSLSKRSSQSRVPRANPPYTPSGEQKKHIDNLSKGPLSATSSNTQTEYFDILPSFQMFQSILRRDDSQFNENLSVKPPVYGDTQNSSATPPSGLSPVTSNDNVLDGISDRLNETELHNDSDGSQDYVFDDENEGHAVSPRNEQAHNHNIAVTVHESGHSPLDNIDMLAKAPNSPIDIKIFVTKRVPLPNSQNELETRLKEYTSGDVVNGYVVITNKSDKPVDFGLFTVSLEGTIKSTDKNLNSGPLDAHKYNKIIVKKFLKMYDLNASYGYTQVPSSAGVEYEAYTIDPTDECQIGLPPERILKPNSKYKKFFTFKFPNKLLDNSCFNSLFSHLVPPPTLGLDRTCFHNRGETIQLNKALGYGFLNMRGTPILTKDYSFEDVSISYTIEAKFIDKLNASNQKHAFSENEINDPNSSSEYVISQSSKYFLRFIPDLSEQLGFFNEWHQYGWESYTSLGIDGKLFQDYYSKTTWKHINKLSHRIDREIDERLDRDNLTVEELKSKNLLNWDEQHFEISEPAKLTDEHEIRYHLENMIGSRPTTVYGKKKKKILSSLVKVGELRLFVRVPSQVIAYASPRLITKYNNGTLQDNLSLVTSNKNENNITSVTSNSDLSLRPVSSIESTHINGLYNRDVRNTVQSVDLSLVFESDEAANKPPLISSIEANLVLWSYNTEYPLPFELGYDFFYTNPKGDEDKHEDDVSITRDNLQRLKDQVFTYIEYLRANEAHLSKEAYLYLKAVKSLGVKKDTLKDYYKTLTSQSHPQLLNNETGWKATQKKGGFRWTKDFTIPLDAINKNNISLIPSFQTCLVGRLYYIQVVVKYKGAGGEQNEFADNVVKVDIPVLVG
ncbi:uncharacterized protein CANTADRAFT_3792 [Suhomyces tanzawaensis NRRL Y-17324]|uniref:Uncharacterized protein n=1 Tax=Suhomyces tanzawaensis NRRL Y-17324 TaxID=984487 RepID=A0A1E4SQC3_9ASCO|nr:uncharacterized protein CANTADRAFT_3792 [Suhomyces tanzawaensis NRRL Y-17324]ODV81713.1 hypothetical protein CANTADRAFT_3792 [Suhomyces tanzawaensis NRRL Y-17324]